VDDDGNVYFVDRGNARVRRIDTSGVITTIAGNGRSCYSGDGGPATDARLNRPEHLWVDAQGNVHVADTFNSRIRKCGLDVHWVSGLGVSPGHWGHREPAPHGEPAL